jgi:hypothetical protein
MLSKVYLSTIILAIALTFSLQLKAQNKAINLPINAKGQIEYIEDVAVPRTTQSILYNRAMHWIISSPTYMFTKIDLFDREFGRLIASGKLHYNNDEVFISLSVDVKDNKAQLNISRFDYNMMTGNIPIDNLSNQKTKEAKILIPKVSEGMKLLIKSFHNAMLSPAKI